MTYIRDEISIVILTKNEKPNINKCLDSVLNQYPTKLVKVFDSGSTDGTIHEVSKRGIEIINWDYISHASSYNRILAEYKERSQHVLILDADMELPPNFKKIVSSFSVDNPSPCYYFHIKMFHRGRELNYASLYPPKALLFEPKKVIFSDHGHAETLNIKPEETELIKGIKINHNDLKNYDEFLATQIRYAKKIKKSLNTDQESSKDRLRVKLGFIFPFLVFIYILFPRLGILDGKTGITYALDRFLTEFIWIRILKNND